MKGSEQYQCPFLRHPYYQSGYTGKSGPLTWFSCDYHKKPIKNIRRCNLAGLPKDYVYDLYAGQINK